MLAEREPSHTVEKLRKVLFASLWVVVYPPANDEKAVKNKGLVRRLRHSSIAKLLNVKTFEKSGFCLLSFFEPKPVSKDFTKTRCK